MKLITFLSLSLFTVVALARPQAYSEVHLLKSVEIDGEKSKYVAQLTVDFHQNAMRVDIYNDICRSLTAKPGEITCMAVAALVKSMTVPILEVGQSCGSMIYKGFVDATPVDGLYTEITVQDNRTRLCKDLRPTVEVEASQFNPWTQTTTNYLAY